ncbi:MAG: hypothetical protein K1W04_08675 [Oscillospiraceae bacterium]
MMGFASNIKEFIVGKQYTRIDLDHHYSNSPYKKAKAYYEQNKSVSGAESVMQKIKTARENYLAEMERYITKERPREEACFSKVKEKGKKKQMFKGLLFAAVVAICVIAWLDGVLHSSAATLLLLLLGMAAIAFAVVTLVIMLIYKGQEALAENTYRRYVDEARSGFNRINGAHDTLMAALYTEIDSLYLASLDPAHREVILMRRDQERQHQEAMQMQKKALQAEKEHQRVVEEEQRRTRAAQEELLAIERERERRYRGY